MKFYKFEISNIILPENSTLKSPYLKIFGEFDNYPEEIFKSKTILDMGDLEKIEKERYQNMTLTAATGTGSRKNYLQNATSPDLSPSATKSNLCSSYKTGLNLKTSAAKIIQLNKMKNKDKMPIINEMQDQPVTSSSLTSLASVSQKLLRKKMITFTIPTNQIVSVVKQSS